jgi:large subunit ribosomal protein L9
MASKIQAILGRDVANLGHAGDIVNVAPGYLRNFLIPKLLALPVSKSRIEQFEHQKKLVQHQLAKLKSLSQEVKDRIEVQKFLIEVKSGDQGKLFGSVGARDIETVLKNNGFTIHHRDIKLEAPLKTVGMHQIPVRLEGGIMATIKVILTAIEEPVKAQDAEENESEEVLDTINEENTDLQ